ncbi:hypothetical protein SNB30_18975 [Escherichia coli]|nr:hypothetical protein [Escherichia coli]
MDAFDVLTNKGAELVEQRNKCTDEGGRALLNKQIKAIRMAQFKEGANKRGNSSRLTQSFHFFMFEPIFSPVNALNQPI